MLKSIITVKDGGRMDLTREQVVDKLLKSYRAYYNITTYDETESPLAALCEFYEHSQKYVLSQKAELWSADSEEFIYLFSISHLTLELYEKYKAYSYEDGMKRIHVGPGHMYSFITPIFICDTCDEDAVKALKKSRIYKSFHFSLHGWMDFHVAAVILNDKRIERNPSGRTTAKILKKILYTKKREKGRFV